jgi:hypothetical protein
MPEQVGPSRSREALIKRAELYRMDAAHIGLAQYKAAERAHRVHYWLGAPTAVVSAIVGTAIFESPERAFTARAS